MPFPVANSNDENHYQTLGVNRDAGLEDIKRAYKRLARETHPDKNRDLQDGQAFNKVKHAFDTLSDPFKRENYDRTLRFLRLPQRAGEGMATIQAEYQKRLNEMRMGKGNRAALKLSEKLDGLRILRDEGERLVELANRERKELERKIMEAG